MAWGNGAGSGGDSSGRATRGENDSRYLYGQDGGNVTEKHYGCYKVGILFSVIIILLLLIGCVPVFFLTHNSNLILLILLVTLILIGIVTYAYFRWQHRRAIQMRRSYEEQKMNLARGPKPSTMSNGKRVDLVPAAVAGPKQVATPITAGKPDLDLVVGKKSSPATANQPRYSFI